MKSVVIISGSPRRGGNCDDAEKIVLDELAARGRAATRLALRDFRIEHCRGCLNCQRGKPCAIRDDFAAAWRLVKRAGAVVWVIPVYWCSPPGLVKDFLDRTVVDFNKGGVMRGKPAHLISVAQSAGFGPQEKILDAWVRWLGGPPLKTRMRLIAFHKGDLLRNASAVRKLKALARKLAWLRHSRRT